MKSTVETKEKPPKPPKSSDPSANNHQRNRKSSFRDVLMETTSTLSQVYEESHGNDMELDIGKNLEQ